MFEIKRHFSAESDCRDISAVVNISQFFVPSCNIAHYLTSYFIIVCIVQSADILHSVHTHATSTRGKALMLARLAAFRSRTTWQLCIIFCIVDPRNVSNSRDQLAMILNSLNIALGKINFRLKVHLNCYLLILIFYTRKSYLKYIVIILYLY